MKFIGLRFDRPETAALCLVLAAALALRLWGVFFGLPHIYHNDEGFEVFRALRLGMGEFDFDRWAKGGYYLVLFVEYGVYFVVALLTGVVSNTWEFATHFVADPVPFWKIGRITTALLGTAAVFVLWWHGRSVAGVWTGLAAALFLTPAYHHVASSHYITVDVPMSLFAFLAVVMMVEDVEGRRKINPYLFAPVAAFAVLCKIPAVLLFIPYFLGCFMRGGLRGPRGLLSVESWIPVVGAGVVYVALNPGVVVRMDEVFALFAAALGLEPSAATGAVDRPFAGLERGTSLWAYYSGALLKSLGAATLGLSLLGIGVGLMRRNRAVALHLSFVLPFFLALAGSSTAHLYYSRYIIPILPGLALFAAIGLAAAVGWLRPRLPVAAPLAVLLALLAVVQPALTAIRFDMARARVDTRTRTVDWIETNVPPGTTVLLEGFPELNSALSVPLQNTPDNIRTMIARLEQTDPGKASYWQLRLKVDTRPAYDLLTVRHFEPWGSLAEYRARGADYAVLRHSRFEQPPNVRARMKAEWADTRQAFYRELEADGRAERMAAFDPEETGSRGGHFEIWRLR